MPIWLVKYYTWKTGPTVCNTVDCSLPGSSVPGLFPARILEWVAISFSRRSSQPRDWTQFPCIVARLFTLWATREVRRTFQFYLGMSATNHLIPLLRVMSSLNIFFFFSYLISLGPGMMEKGKWCDVMWKTTFTYFHVPILFLWFLLITKYVNELTSLMDSGKDYACQCRRRSFDPWVEISWRRKWYVNLFQYSCLETSMDRGNWWATAHGITDTT